MAGVFSSMVQAASKRLIADMESRLRRSAEAIGETLVVTTPVKTGKARSNWVARTGRVSSVPDVPGLSSPNREANAGAATTKALSQIQAVVRGWKPLAQGSIFFVNGVPYIATLDDGTSRQAPAGMTAQAILKGKEAMHG